MSTPNPLRSRGSLVDALSSALDRGSHGLENVPGLLKRILAEDLWREFETARGERVVHDRFESFVTAPPLRGLGATMDLITRIVGTADPELLAMLREAQRIGRGVGSRSDSERLNTDDAAYQIERLARDAPEEYAAVLRGDRSISAAAVRAGIRNKRMSIRIDSAESAAETLRKHMPPEQLTLLRKLLKEDSQDEPSRIHDALREGLAQADTPDSGKSA